MSFAGDILCVVVVAAIVRCRLPATAIAAAKDRARFSVPGFLSIAFNIFSFFSTNKEIEWCYHYINRIRSFDGLNGVFLKIHQ